MASSNATTGQPTKLAADRTTIAQRVAGSVQLRDEPAAGDGRTYLIEPSGGAMTELKALVADYVADYIATAHRLEDEIPMKECWF